MGPSESPTTRPGNQPRRPTRIRRRPRARGCLLKGCGQRFHPRRPQQRYCSEQCRESARRWSRWKAQQRYRRTITGKQRRNGQSRRYRGRVRSRKPLPTQAVDEAARVITKNFFRCLLRPPRLLRLLRGLGPLSGAAFLFAGLPQGFTACSPARAGSPARS